MTISLPVAQPAHIEMGDPAPWVVQYVECPDASGIPVELLREDPSCGRRILVVSGVGENPELNRHQSLESNRLEIINDVECFVLDSLDVRTDDWNVVRLDSTTKLNESAAILAQQLRKRIVAACPTIILADRYRAPMAPHTTPPPAILTALIAIGLSATELQFIGPSEGIYTADPSKVSMAKLLSVLSFAEWAELASHEVELPNHASMRLVLQHGIPVRIRGISSLGSGTLIHRNPEALAPATPVVSEIIQGRRISDFAASGRPLGHSKLPTAVTVKENVQVLEIGSRFGMGAGSIMPEVLNVLKVFNIAMELMSTSKMHVSVAIWIEAGSDRLCQLVEELERRGTTVSVRHNMCILSLIGRNMPSMIGIAGRMFSTLAQRNVNIEMMSQSSSEMNISCVIDGKDAVKALNLVHHACLSGIPGAMSTGLRSVY